MWEASPSLSKIREKAMSDGILRVNAAGTTVNLVNLTWAKPQEIKVEIREFFKQHGYAEAEALPYVRTALSSAASASQEGLIVTFPSTEAQKRGWHRAVDTSGLPF